MSHHEKTHPCCRSLSLARLPSSLSFTVTPSYSLPPFTDYRKCEVKCEESSAPFPPIFFSLSPHLIVMYSISALSLFSKHSQLLLLILPFGVSECSADGPTKLCVCCCVFVKSHRDRNFCRSVPWLSIQSTHSAFSSMLEWSYCNVTPHTSTHVHLLTRTHTHL